MSSRFLREWHILGDMSLVGRRKAHVPRGCHCHLLLPASCYLCPCLCPGPELLLGPAPLPWPRQLSVCSSGPPLLPVSVEYLWITHTHLSQDLPCACHLRCPLRFPTCWHLCAEPLNTPPTHSPLGQVLRACWHSEHLIRQQPLPSQ